METYLGLKQVEAEPDTRTVGDDVNGHMDIDGYVVVYEDGYRSWSPKDVFERAYRKQEGGIGFSIALEGIQRGERWTRTGWNGADMFIFLVPGSEFAVNRPPLLGIYPEGTEIKYHAHVDMKTAQGTVVPWVVSHTDMLTTDWERVDG